MGVKYNYKKMAQECNFTNIIVTVLIVLIIIQIITCTYYYFYCGKKEHYSLATIDQLYAKGPMDYIYLTGYDGSDRYVYY